MLKPYMDRLAPFAPTLLRIIVGITFVVMGLPKLENPAGFTAFLERLHVPLPMIFTWIIILLEVFGGLLLILGLGIRWITILFVIEMLVTTLVVKRNVGFVAPAGRPGVGYELDLLLLVSSLVLLILGPGTLSVERNLIRREL